MDLEETEARIVEQLERILDAEERIVEWDTWIERVNYPTLKGGVSAAPVPRG
jgi:hypothetical protein